MKIAGKRPAKPSRTITLASGVEVTLVAPSLGVYHEALRIVPPPAKPVRIVRSPQGEVLRREPVDSPGYDAEVAKASLLQSAYIAWTALDKGPGKVEFDTPLPAAGPNRDFVGAILKELGEAGFTPNDLKQIAEFIAGVEVPDEAEVQEAEGFFDSAQSRPGSS